MAIQYLVDFSWRGLASRFQLNILFSGPDAVKYIVNHAVVQVIFCVPQTLNVVSLIILSHRV